MTPLINWLALIVFAAGGILLARWIIQQSYSRWTGPDTGFARAFLYLLTLASIAGISFVGVSVLYYEILTQPGFLTLVGLSGAVKFLIIFTGVWYGALVALRMPLGQGK